ncbi:Chromosome partitioning protein parA [Vibrio nigripulchritudo MADA3029]|uniref:Chromosome partitioning protein parA n=1 Tax=Vibrio nigripulchritudo TaxID=28173 RepID=U4K3I9_9VIBR|nr:ParA family protein [Vibrio nigripulchritudo]EGU60806.1 ParA family protein [Vibrio nigripulchritudo ATCC 27043]CCN33385.1 Chromosome partitioning protein parA [Vibrio nigripulchritudo AM115]CCN42925.1 Chromosome partitioning protein parA [Vibrio nigripulchritudo FTn2]CCN46197.1 Chromosome partitioning protein parA [Vibrio nigripulchritudo MADA3020]CCN55062.1 Chromosome partitioning protein parA [Vibrio nigripulchritudo MADA3021]
MGRIISIANQKGGVGKTTTCINLAASMAATKRKVLVIDLDPQGNATMASGVDKYNVEATAFDLLVEDTPFEHVVTCTTSGGYDLIAANGDVTAAEIKLMEVFAREVRLKNALASVRDNYDFIFIDCPPSLNLLTINAMAASDSVLVPMQCEYFALEGLTALMDTISKLAAVVNENLKIEGLLRTMYDPRNRLSNEVSDQLKTHFGDKVYRTVIPRNVRLAEAPSHGKPAMYYDKYSAGAKAYLALAGEMLRREEMPA